MKKITLIFLLLTFKLLACTGDCLTCHPALIPTIQTDERHKPMLGCINCHSADPNSMAECGSDCFSCHTKEKIDKPHVREHDVIESCRQCHMKMKRESFEAPPSQSKDPLLKDLLLP